MTAIRDIPEPLVDLLERVVMSAVAITARATVAIDADLTFAQWRVLLVVGEQPAGQPIGDVAIRVGARPSAASRLIGRMKRRGLLQGTKDDPDRRVTRVRLTRVGRDLRRRILQVRRSDLRAVIESASLTPSDTEAIAKLARSFGPFA